MNGHRRRITFFALGVSALATGCVSKPPLRLTEHGAACYRAGRGLRRRRTCTPYAVPGADVEADAKRFAPAPDRLTVYLVRQRWADSRNLVEVSLDSAPAVATVPRSFLRLRMPPGSHRIVANWPKGSTALELDGVAGDVAYVELRSSFWAWDSTYTLEVADAASAQGRVSKLRLVADVQ